MLITDKQLNKIQEAIDVRLADRILRHIQTNHPESIRQYDTKEAEKIILTNIQIARQNSFITEYGVTFFVVLIFLIGPAFFRHEKLKRLFMNENITEREKSKVMYEVMTDNDWENAGKLKQ